MCISNAVRVIVLIFCAGLGTVASAAPVTLRVITTMNRYYGPIGAVEESPGVFYFATNGSGVFSITTSGTKTFLTAFQNGYLIESPLVSGWDGRLYSMVQHTVQTANAFSVAGTQGRVIYGSQNYVASFTQNLPDGSLLGVGASTQTFQQCLVRSDLQGVVAPFYQFPSGDRLPLSVTYGRDGNYYGVAYVEDGSGFVYMVTPTGSLTQVYNFPVGTFGLQTQVGVPIVQASDGNLYGTTPNGGANGTGTIYKLTPAGKYTLLYTFPENKTSFPAELIEGSDGNLYGATSGLIAGGGYSLLFRITPSGQYTVLHAMNFLSEGGCPCPLTQGSDGSIYGTAPSGGSTGGGTVFALDAGLPKPAPQPLRFQPESGPV